MGRRILSVLLIKLVIKSMRHNESCPGRPAPGRPVAVINTTDTTDIRTTAVDPLADT